MVATNLATGLPPERCAQCGFGPLAPDASAVPAFPPSPLAPTPEPAPLQAQAAPVFIPLTPSGPRRDDVAEPAPRGDTASAAPTPAPPPAPSAVLATAGPATVAPVPGPLPEDADEAVPAPPVDLAPASEADDVDPDAAHAPPGPAERPAPDQAQHPTSNAPAASARPAPRFLARRSGMGAGGLDRREVALAAGLAVLLVVQLLLADRERLAGIAAWRPVVAALCTPLPCSVAPWREPSAIGVAQRDVRPVPGRPGVLQVSATIRNEARWAQAWPRLVLTLSDLDGRALGMRAFEPAEYLAAPPTDITIASGQEAAIRMEIVEPSPRAVAFNFDFR